MNTPTITLPTYPARPVNGGPYDVALRLRTDRPECDWSYTPKYNGWRALVHLPTGAIFNRRGERLSIEDEFAEAVAALRTALDCGPCRTHPLWFEWVDCEALERRHNLGRGCLIVLDVIPEPAYRQTTFDERSVWLHQRLPVCFHDRPDSFGAARVWLPKVLTPGLAIWLDLQTINRRMGCEFYEGMVAKKRTSLYPFQLRNPEADSTCWVKHRWAF